MNREYHHWHSPALERDMELLVFGRAGPRLLAFPPANGRFFDWENQGMVGALAEHLEQGWVQVICVDSVDAEAWHNADLLPAARAARHVQYDRYLLKEVLPFTAEHNRDPFLSAAGVDFGAYHAVNFALRHPKQVNRTIGLSGVYDIGRWSDGNSGDDIYLNNPVAFIANEHELPRLTALRKLNIILTVGRDDGNRPNNEQFSTLLWEKDIWHALRIWDGPAHDWPSWQQMIRLYVGGHD